jgi:uncharacterized protein YfaS (alpha-2-macroglobulin family)
MKNVWWFIALLVSALVVGAARADEPLRIESFAPEGSVKAIRQVTARFTRPMTTLGDPRQDDPFAIECPAPGKGRWADPRNWVYDFDADLPAGLRCKFTAKPALRSIDGAAFAQSRTYEFTTGGPAIVAEFPREGWEAVDAQQVFLLKLDAPATKESVEAHARCLVEGISEEIGVEVIAGRERDALLAARTELGYEYYRLLWKSGRESYARARSRKMEENESLVLALRCARTLPPATQLQLRWGKGIETASRIATEQDQTLAFKVRPAFTAQVECTRANPRGGCLPMLPIVANFSAPVPRALALAIRLRAKDGAIMAPTTKASKEVPTLESVTFDGPFAEAAPVRIELPKDLVDDAGRPLENAARFPLEVRVDPFPPLAKFAGAFGILEAAEGGVLPVTLRNLETDAQGASAPLPARVFRVPNEPKEAATWLAHVAQADDRKGHWVEPDASDTSTLKTKLEDQEYEQATGRRRLVWREETGTESVFGAMPVATRTITIPKPAGAKPMEVVGIPLGAPGLYVVEIESRNLGKSLLGRDESRYVATAALVTNLAVHFKWGRESSLAWVTRLDDGKPVAGATVRVTDYCSTQQRWQGTTDADGVARIATSLGEPHERDGCWGSMPAPLLVSAELGDDFSFTRTSWANGIGPSDFGLRAGYHWDRDLFHTVLDRPLFRAGETVSMKHFARRHDSSGVALLEGLPAKRTVHVVHEGSGQTYDLAASFGADCVAESTWTIPAEAKLGAYTVSIEHEGGYRESASFKVEQYRLPTMRASVIGPPKPLVSPKSATLDLHVAYLSGGGAAGLPVKLRTLVEPRAATHPDYADYAFGGAAPKEGVAREDRNPMDYDFESEAEEGAEGAETESAAQKAQVIPLALDATGSARVTVPNLPPLDAAAQLTAELEYADANGEILTASTRVRLVPSALEIGIRREGWVASPEQMRFRVVALGLDGKPVAKQKIDVALYRSSTFSYRKRLIGGFYAYETTRETRRLDAKCEGRTDAQGLLACEVAPGASGEIIVRAESRDGSGALAGATTSIWAVGADEWWFGGTSGDRMDLLPEQKSYESGDRARFQVRMPFRDALALVTVEREGVLDAFVTKLGGRKPIVEVPIADAYAPNVYVSVLAVRGRVARPEGKTPKDGAITALVDLNKPAYRLGEAAIRVGWKPHRLDVRVAAERATYEVRENAKVQVHVARADGAALPAGTEIAFAAVDEALLELAPNGSWALLDAMMGERGIEVHTSTAQMQVIGKRHYGRKAVPHGGGGGRERDRAREKFDSLLLWKGRVALDAHGDAALEVPLNDAITSFKLVAIAHGGAGAFGTGSATIQTTQELILVSGLPPLVREGDKFAATFTVRNTSAREIDAEVAPTLAPASSEPLVKQRATIPAGRSHDFVWDVTAPVGADVLSWEVAARDLGGGKSRDRLKVGETVVPAYPVRTYQATIAQLDATPLVLPAERPKGAIAGRGGLEVTLRARLGDGLDGVREYMSRYPYICLEQNLSRAVALEDEGLWSSWIARLPAYSDRDGLLKYFPSDWIEGDDALTAYVLAIGSEAGWTIDEAQRKRLIAALQGFVKGRIVRGSALPTADLAIRKLAAIDALSRYGAADPSMLDSITIEPNLWPTSAVIDWVGILDRIDGVKEREARRTVALGVLRSRLNFQGTIMTFSTERTDALWWLMISSDSNANRMLLATLDRAPWREDVPRLVRGALGRQQFGHWNTTVANAWGVLAMKKFSAAFESVPVSGATAVRYANKSTAIEWPREHDSAQVDLPWRDGRADLSVLHEGGGKPWAIVRATAALPLDKPLSTGFTVTRSMTGVEQRDPAKLTRGDVVRVHLDLEAQSDMSWVVVDDPVPAGASVIGSLGGQSGLLKRDEKRGGWGWLAYEERRFDAYRAYYRFVPKGKWSIEYTVRLNNPGTFLLPATRIEAMYAPEMFGETPNAPLTVEAAP